MMKRSKFSIIEEAKKKAESVLLQCKCGSFDFVPLSNLQSGMPRSCGTCFFDLDDLDYKKQVDRLSCKKNKSKLNKKLQKTIFDL